MGQVAAKHRVPPLPLDRKRIMHSIALLGWFGAALSIVLPWPQVWRSCIQGRTSGLSVAACWMGVAMPVGWITYGLLTGETVQIVTNVVTGSAGLGVLSAVLIRNSDVRTARKLATSAAGAVAILTAAAVTGTVAGLTTVTGTQAATVLGILLALASIVSAVPQPLSLLRDRTQDMSGLSPLRWRLAAGSTASWLAYGLATGQPAVWLSATVGLTAAAIVCWVLWTAGRTPAPVRVRAVTPYRARGTARVVHA